MLIPGPVKRVQLGTSEAGPGISQRAAAARTQGPWRGLVCGPIGLGRYAQQDRVRVKAGETYRQPQAASFKLQFRMILINN